MDFTLFYNGRAVAVVDDDGWARLLPAAEAYERDHPVRRFVAAMCLYLADLGEGLLPVPEDLALAASAYARELLLPLGRFLTLAELTDAELAEHFNVPLAQVEERRVDLVPERV